MSSSIRLASRDTCRIVVTGLGIVGPLGRTTAQFWESLVETADASAGRRRPGVADFSGGIDDFGDLPKPLKRSLKKSLKLMNRETQMGVAAGQQALAASRLLEEFDPERVGVCFGAGNVSMMPEDFASAVETCTDESGQFEMDRWGPEGLDEMAPLWLLKCLPNMPACHLGILNDLRGPSNTHTQRDVAFTMAVAEACRNIRSDEADAMLVGATGTMLSPFNLMHARLEEEIADASLPTQPAENEEVTPFPGEGAAALVLESLHAARDRGATIYGEILGWAANSSVGHDGVVGCGRALTSAIRQALRQAALSPEGIGHIHAHGLNSAAVDRAEARAVHNVLGDAAASTPVVATKSRLGHASAGAAAIETVCSLLALEHGTLFSTPRTTGETDCEWPLRFVEESHVPAGDAFLSLSLFRRGLGSCLAVGRFQD